MINACKKSLHLLLDNISFSRHLLSMHTEKCIWSDDLSRIWSWWINYKTFQFLVVVGIWKWYDRWKVQSFMYFIEGRSPSRHEWRFYISQMLPLWNISFKVVLVEAFCKLTQKRRFVFSFSSFGLIYQFVNWMISSRKFPLRKET